MDSFNMTTLDNSLIGINKDHTINAYLKRDQEMMIDPTTQIYKSLDKLGYLNINSVTKLQGLTTDLLVNKIKTELTNDWDSPFRNKTINEILYDLKDNLEYQQQITNLNYRIGRAFVLSSFIGSNKSKEFYNALNLDELAILGY